MEGIMSSSLDESTEADKFFVEFLEGRFYDWRCCYRLGQEFYESKLFRGVREGTEEPTITASTSVAVSRPDRTLSSEVDTDSAFGGSDDVSPICSRTSNEVVVVDRGCSGAEREASMNCNTDTCPGTTLIRRVITITESVSNTFEFCALQDSSVGISLPEKLTDSITTSLVSAKVNIVSAAAQSQCTGSVDITLLPSKFNMIICYGEGGDEDQTLPNRPQKRFKGPQTDNNEQSLQEIRPEQRFVFASLPHTGPPTVAVEQMVPESTSAEAANAAATVTAEAPRVRKSRLGLPAPSDELPQREPALKIVIDPETCSRVAAAQLCTKLKYLNKQAAGYGKDMDFRQLKADGQNEDAVSRSSSAGGIMQMQAAMTSSILINQMRDIVSASRTSPINPAPTSVPNTAPVSSGTTTSSQSRVVFMNRPLGAEAPPLRHVASPPPITTLQQLHSGGKRRTLRDFYAAKMAPALNYTVLPKVNVLHQLATAAHQIVDVSVPPPTVQSLPHTSVSSTAASFAITNSSLVIDCPGKTQASSTTFTLPRKPEENTRVELPDSDMSLDSSGMEGTTGRIEAGSQWQIHGKPIPPLIDSSYFPDLQGGQSEEKLPRIDAATKIPPLIDFELENEIIQSEAKRPRIKAATKRRTLIDSELENELMQSEAKRSRIEAAMPIPVVEHGSVRRKRGLLDD